MSSALQALKKNSSLEKLTKALKQTNKQKNDERYWRPELDKAGNGFAVIRFLDSPLIDVEVHGEDAVPWVQLFTHGFQGPGGWYIENSLTTLGQPDPVADYNSKLWKSGTEANKEIARKQKRRLGFISNILVVKDPANPSNEGKVFLFQYGKKIHDKIRKAIDPSQEEKDAALLEGVELKKIDVFSLWTGHNFTLRVRKVEGYTNYDTSGFTGLQTAENPDAKGSAIAPNDEAIEEIWKKTYSLKELVSPDKFKSYSELEAKMNKALGLDGTVAPKGTVKSTPVEEKSAPWDETETPVSDEADAKMLSMFDEVNQEE